MLKKLRGYVYTEKAKGDEELRESVLCRLNENGSVCREEFLINNPPAKSRERRTQLKRLNSIFQELVVSGAMWRDRGGDYTFFRHHGVPTMWRRRT